MPHRKSRSEALRGREPVERSFQTHDGAEIFYRYWPATNGDAAGAIVLFHRGHEHGGRMAHLVDELRMPDHAFYAWDARGHGRSPGERGYSPSFAASVRDVDCFMREIERQDGFATCRHRRGGAVGRRRAGGHLGARLRAEDQGAWCSRRPPSR